MSDDRMNERWAGLAGEAARVIGPERAGEILGGPGSEAERLEKLLSEVMECAAETREGEISRFEFQMRRSERLAAIGQMAAVIGHEVNNPLGALSGFIQLMVSEYPESEKGIEFLDEMAGEVRRIRGTLDRLLDFSHHSLGAAESRRTRLDLSELIAATLDLVMPQAHFSKVKVVSDLAESGVIVVGNADELKQVFMNFLLNAMQAMPTGGDLHVRVFGDTATADDIPPYPAPRRSGDPPNASFYHVRRDPAAEEAPVPFWRKGDAVVRVVITDTGVGIRQENLDLIFEPFFTTKGRGEGTGLGLSTSLGIISSHGGDVRVRSEPGKGATFTVTLSAVPSSSSAGAPDDGRATP